MSFTKALYAVYRKLPTSIQNLLITIKVNERWKHENSSAFQDSVAELMKKQYWDSAAIHEYQKERLVRVLLAARSTEYYSKLLPSESVINDDPFSVLLSVPVLSKESVRSDFKQFINTSFNGKLVQHGTSGTTGTPLQTIWTQECIDMERALIWRQRIQTGLQFGSDWRGMLGGHRIVPLNQKNPPFWRVSRFAKQVYFSTYHISQDNAPYYLEALKRYNVQALEGYPSVLYAIAYSFKKCGLEYPLNGIYYGAESLLDFQRKVIEEVFHCYIWDYYGLTERNASASEFECKNGLHENWENCILEIVDSYGEPLSNGEYGELIGTSLSNLGFPLLRYRTGDMSNFLSGQCTCRRHSRRLSRIDTKREDLLHMPDGTLLSASNLTYPFKEVENILESQIYQESRNQICIRIIPAPEYSEEDGVKLLEGLGKLIPESVGINLLIVDKIPRTKSGKFRFCISTITELDDNPISYSL